MLAERTRRVKALKIHPLSHEQADTFAREWHRVQAMFVVDHPRVVENYRVARALSTRRDRGEAATEELRQAVVNYRKLFEDLLATEEGSFTNDPSRCFNRTKAAVFTPGGTPSRPVSLMSRGRRSSRLRPSSTR